MIVNVPAQGSNALLTMDATAAQGQCEFNFLKRKLDAEDNDDQASAINTEEGNILTASYQGCHSPNSPVWQKRHIVNNIAAATQNPTPTSTTTNCIDNPTTCFMTHEFQCGQTDQLVSTAGATMHVPHEPDINDNFNLIGGSSFMSDLFAYDANLIVPVTASLVTSSSICVGVDGSSGGTETEPTIVSLPTTYTTVTNNGITHSYDDGSSWQATDLLELDHRYNSALQNNITELNPTITLKQAQTTDQLPMGTLHEAQAIEQEQQQQQSVTPLNFLVPTTNTQKNFPAMSGKYRVPQSLPTAPKEPETDFEDKNLSWLLNFKFDELPHLSPDVGANNNNTATQNGHTTLQRNSTSSPLSSTKSNSSSPSSVSTSAPQQTQCDRSRSPKNNTKTVKKFEELVMEATAEVDGNDIIVAEQVIVEDTTRAPKKPPFTYTELIEYALEDKGELTVSGIYQWISDRFPFYKSNDDRWKNSVRHNLSINPHFRKGVKAPQGAGHLWTISSGDSAENVLAWEHKKQRLELFFKMESMNRERLQQHHQQQLQRQREQQGTAEQQQPQNAKQSTPEHSHNYIDEAAAAAATITREMLSTTESGGSSDSMERLPSRQLAHDLGPFNDLMSDEELRKTAGQILNGLHREVEVQSVNSIISTYHDVLLDDEDYLNPIHKDISVHESGLSLRHAMHSHSHGHGHLHTNGCTASQYYVTEIDPLELGIQMTHQVTDVETDAEEVLFNDDFNLNYFGYNTGNDIVA